jgi:hypothetical protein
VCHHSKKVGNPWSRCLQLITRSSRQNSHKVYFLITQISGITNLVLLMLYLGTSIIKSNNRIYYICVYKLHFFDKNLPSKIEVRLIHGILCIFLKKELVPKKKSYPVDD